MLTFSYTRTFTVVNNKELQEFKFISTFHKLHNACGGLTTALMSGGRVAWHLHSTSMLETKLVQAKPIQSNTPFSECICLWNVLLATWCNSWNVAPGKYFEHSHPLKLCIQKYSICNWEKIYTYYILWICGLYRHLRLYK